MSKLSIQPISPLDGRYRAAVSDLGFHLSEAGLNRARIAVEVEWLIQLSTRNLLETNAPITDEQQAELRKLIINFSDTDVATLAETEATTKHDVKAIEYFIRDKLDALGLSHLAELTHFACTSEDINNLSYAITVRDAVKKPLHKDVAKPGKFRLADSAEAKSSAAAPAEASAEKEGA